MAPKSHTETRVPLGAREVKIIRRLNNIIKLPVTQIAKAVERNKSTVYGALDKKWRLVKRGRKEVLSKVQVKLLLRTTKAMVQQAAAKKEVTLAVIMRKAKVMAGAQGARKALHKAGVRFRKMRSKPLLTKEDVKHRYAFAKKYRKKPKSFWKKVNLYIDVKTFPVYLNEQALAVAAMREVRGAYRQRGQGLDESYVVLPKQLKYNTGAKSARIAGGVGNGRMLLWHELEKRWSGKAAAKLYLGPVRSVLRKANPKKRSFTMLEDNDPTGFK